MKNTLKDFLFFNQKDKIAIILLLALIGIAGLYSIYINSLSKLDPSHFLLQEQIEKEFKTYEENLESKEIVSLYKDESEVIETAVPNKEIKKQNKAKTEGQLVDLNNADLDTLLKIPGIGKTLALRIIEYRAERGYFDEVDQLLEIKGITNNKLTQIIPFLVLKEKTNIK